MAARSSSTLGPWFCTVSVETPGSSTDLRHRGPRVPALGEQLGRGEHDPFPGRGRLLLPQLRDVAASAMYQPKPY